MSSVEFVNSGSPIPALSLVTGDGVSMIGTGIAGDPLKLSSQQPYAAVVNTIYVRPTGNDGNDGSLAKPYATLAHAVTKVPTVIPPGQHYVIDCTGINEVLPADFTLPECKSGYTIDSLAVADPYFLFNAALLIQATPAMAGLPNGEDVIAAADIAGQVNDPVSQMVRLTLKAGRNSWGGDALKGYFVVDAVGGGNNAVIWQSAANELVICTADQLTAPIKIMKPGATIRGTSSANTVATGSARGALRAVNCDSVGFSGLDIANSGGLTDPGLALGGSGGAFAQMCWLQSPQLMAASPALCRAVRCHITGQPTLSNFVTLQQSLCEGWPASAFQNLIWFLGRRCVFDACATLEPKGGFPGAPAIGVPMLAFYLYEGVVANAPGAGSDGVLFHGGRAQLTNIDLYNNGRDGVRCAAGQGFLQLTGCGTTSADGATVVKNGAYGLNVQDGLAVAADATTYGNAKPLTGVTNDVLVGALAAETWAAFAAGADLYDITAVAAGGATGSGSRLYRD